MRHVKGLIMEKKRFTTPYREFITRDEKGRYHVRLGPQTFSTNYRKFFIPTHTFSLL
jgi:hypothetical protein